MNRIEWDECGALIETTNDNGSHAVVTMGEHVPMIEWIESHTRGDGGRLMDEVVQWMRDHGHTVLDGAVVNTKVPALRARYGCLYTDMACTQQVTTAEATDLVAASSSGIHLYLQLS